MRQGWIKYDSIDSTNNVLSELQKRQKVAEGTLIITDYQESGRGQGDHAWMSRKGENLLMSLLLHPAFLSASKQFHLSMMASLALCDVLTVSGIDPQIKWPNDILSGGGKIAGILIEHGITAGSIAHTIIGIGLNLNQEEFPVFPFPASSIIRETGKRVVILDVAEAVESALMSRYRVLKEGKTKLIEEEYMENLYLAGEPGSFMAGEELFEGIIKGVTGFGELKVEHKGEIRIFSHGSIKLMHGPDRT